MSNTLGLYCRYVALSFRAQLQYRASFVLYSLGHLFITGVDFLVLVALFQRFDSLGGWSLAEVSLLYGLVNMSFALAESLARGFDDFAQLVKKGDFDRLLLRPRSTALQVAASDVQLFRIGRFSQGCAVFVFGWWQLSIRPSGSHCCLLLFALAGGASLFAGLFVFQATLAFWTIESLEIMNALTYGGTEAGEYPLHIYRPWFRRLFTFVIPLACTVFIPVQTLLGRLEGTLYWLTPAVGFIFLGLALCAWQVGVRHYTSTGS